MKRFRDEDCCRPITSLSQRVESEYVQISCARFGCNRPVGCRDCCRCEICCRCQAQARAAYLTTKGSRR